MPAGFGACLQVSQSQYLGGASRQADCFAGNGLNVVKVMPESAIKFGGYEVCSYGFHGDVEICDANLL